MKLIKFSSLFLTVIILSACGSDSTDSPNATEEITVAYSIVQDDKAAKMEQRAIRVTTESNKESEFNGITSSIMEEYKEQGLDSMHLYIHAPDGDSFGKLKAHSYIAYTQKGAAQTGVDKANSYKIELEETQLKSSNASNNEPTEEEWQASYRKIALSEADRYIELTEKNGKQEADRLESYSGVIKQQAAKMTETTSKEKFNQLADLVLSDKPEEVKALKAELELEQ